MANFIPPANGASQGNYFLAKIPKMAVFEAKRVNKNYGGTQTCKLFLKWFPFLNSRGMKLKILEKRFWGLAHDNSTIADLRQTRQIL